MKAWGVLGLVLSLAGAVPLAHGDTKPLHGGVVKEVGDKSFELVTTAAGAELYVLEDGQDIISSQMSVILTIYFDGITSEVIMLAAGGNKFVTRDAKFSKGAKVVVMLVAADQSKTTARFTIK
jgi:hypothetical protein